MKPLENELRSFDGTRIAYRRWGEDQPGKTPLLFCSGIACNDVYWRSIAPRIARDRLVLTWDYPHHGDSGPAANPSALDILSLASHAAAVLDHAEVDAAALAGHSMGVQVILEFFRAHRSSTRALIPIAGPFSRTVGNLYGTSIGFWMLAAAELVAKMRPELSRGLWKLSVNPGVADPVGRAAGLIGTAPVTVMREYFDHLAQLDPIPLLEMFRQGQAHSAEDMLDTIDVPVLILHGTADVMSPFALAEQMAERIPGAEIRAIEGGAHTLPGEQPELIVSEIESFLTTSVDRDA